MSKCYAWTQACAGILSLLSHCWKGFGSIHRSICRMLVSWWRNSNRQVSPTHSSSGVLRLFDVLVPSWAFCIPHRLHLHAQLDHGLALQVLWSATCASLPAAWSWPQLGRPSAWSNHFSNSEYSACLELQDFSQLNHLISSPSLLFGFVMHVWQPQGPWATILSIWFNCSLSRSLDGSYWGSVIFD